MSKDMALVPERNFDDGALAALVRHTERCDGGSAIQFLVSDHEWLTFEARQM
jgi:hypothetical protein